MYNIEKSTLRRGEYVGYGGGYAWRIIKQGYWYAYAQGSPDVLHGLRLKDLQAKLEGLTK
tara:strand:+ start:294 stop:473 length:180 start_codon:yes stop_codon:yes gene_type:complete